VLGWANAFHVLGVLWFGKDYDAAHRAVRRPPRAAGQPNDNAINVVRLNELSLGSTGSG